MTRWIPFLIPVVLVAAVVAVVGAFIVPAFQSIIATHAETVAAHEQLERRYQTTLTRSRAQREFASLERTLAAIRERIPTADDALAFVRSIEAIAANRRLEVRIAIDWSPAKPPNAQQFTRTPMTIEFSGPYPALVAALRDIERLPFPPAASHLTASGTKLVLQSQTLWRTEPGQNP